MQVKEFFATNDRIALFDTEFTSWEGAQERDWGGEGEYREIIQIAAVIIDLNSGVELDIFERFIKPRINSILSDYIQNLTHITQEKIERGSDFLEAYTDFLQWSDDLPLYSYSRGMSGIMHRTGDGRILKENIDLYKLEVEYPEHRFHNIAEVFRRAGIETEKYTSGSLYEYFGIEMNPNNIHNAMHDVRSLKDSLFELKRSIV